MSIIARLYLVAFIAIAGCASLATSDTNFVDLENRWLDALRTHDTAALDRLLDDSFIDATFRGAIRTKHDVLAGPPVAAAYHTIRLDDVKVRRYGSGTAIVTGVNVLQGATAEDVVRVRFTDVFVAKDGAWRAVSAQETLESGPPGPQSSDVARPATSRRRIWRSADLGRGRPFSESGQ